MKRTLAVCILLLCAVGASAGTITSISPSSVKVNSGEHFLTINGSGLGTVVVFDGPAGHFEVNTNANFSTHVATWVPLDIMRKSGYYNVYVRGGTGDSNVVVFEVQGFKFWPFVIIVPDVLWAQPLNREGAYVKYDVFPYGGEDPNPRITCFPASGDFFKMGRTTVNCDGVNAYGEKAQASFAVVVQDTVAPTLFVPREPIVVKAQSREGAYVQFDAKANDDLWGDLPADCSPRSGSLFPVGKTTVHCMATDPDLNTGHGTFLVEVVGEVKWYPLTIKVPGTIYVDARGPEGTTVDYKVESTGDTPEVTCYPKSGSIFPIGTTTVACDAIDRYGMRGHAEFLVQVIDPKGPFIEKLYATPDIIPGDGRMHRIEIVAYAVDEFDPRPVCTVYNITSNQRIDHGDHDKDQNDQATIVGDLTVDLRGSYSRGDRTYDVWVGCQDYYGNRTVGSARVTVPYGSANNTEPTTTKKKGPRG